VILQMWSCPVLHGTLNRNDVGGCTAGIRGSGGRALNIVFMRAMPPSYKVRSDEC
jgi:hypothetical protein